MVEFQSNSCVVALFETDITGFVILWPWSYVQRHFTKACIVSYGEEPAWRFVVVKWDKLMLSFSLTVL